MWSTAILFFCLGTTVGMICMAFVFSVFDTEDEIDPHAEEFTQDR
jgi:hypothetical protein